MSALELLEGVGAGFHIANQIRAASADEGRARLLLQVPDQLLLSMTGAISRACYDANFALGQNFIDARIAALCARRGPDGLLFDRDHDLLEQYRGQLVQLSGGK